MPQSPVKARPKKSENGFYDVMFVGDTAGGKRIICSVAGDKDPGYGSTSKMIAEAPAMGMALVERLENSAGLTFKIEKT